MNGPRISIIVPTKGDSKYLSECISQCLNLDYSNYEIIVVPDFRIGINLPKTREIISGPVGPSVKRNLAAKQSSGEILAFIDADAYPSQDWLKCGVRYFYGNGVVAVGGPNLTPLSDSFMQQASGLVLSSIGATLDVRYRYTPLSMREVEELPTCNLLVLKLAFEKVGGFVPEFWPGEDSVFCLQMRSKIGGTIIYSPDIKVYHHRRPLFRPHLIQFAFYGKTRGRFLRIFPQMSSHLTVFVHPLLFAALAIGLFLSILFPAMRLVYSIIFSIWLLTFIIASSRGKNWYMNALVVFGVLATSLVYGLFFWIGLLSDKRN